MTGVSVVLTVALLAYGAGRWHRGLPPGRSGRPCDVEARLAEPERPALVGGPAGGGLYCDGPGHLLGSTPRAAAGLGRLDKHSTVSHYEALASQVAHERQHAGPAWCSPRVDGRGGALRLVWSAGGTGLMDGRRG